MESKSKKYSDLIATSNLQHKWTDHLSGFKQILESRPFASTLLNLVAELAEKTYQTTSIEGREIIRNQLEEAQYRLDVIFDGVAKTKRDIESKLTKYAVTPFPILDRRFSSQQR
jgi:menaquinone-dependent protoporphyrinogen IX oxidase